MYWERHSPSQGPRDIPREIWRFDFCRSCYLKSPLLQGNIMKYILRVLFTLTVSKSKLPCQWWEYASYESKNHLRSELTPLLFLRDEQTTMPMTASHFCLGILKSLSYMCSIVSRWRRVLCGIGSILSDHHGHQLGYDLNPGGIVFMKICEPAQSLVSQTQVWQVEVQWTCKPGVHIIIYVIWCPYNHIYVIWSVTTSISDQNVTCSHKVGSNKKTIGGLSGTCTYKNPS